MAIRVEELGAPFEAPFEAPTEARIYRFPVEAVRPSRAELRRRAIHRRRAVARRRAAAATLVVVISIAMLFAGGPSSVSSAGGQRRSPRGLVVQPGQTLWSLAERYAGPGVDPRAYVDAILALNGLDAPPDAGVRIRLPR